MKRPILFLISSIVAVYAGIFLISPIVAVYTDFYQDLSLQLLEESNGEIVGDDDRVNKSATEPVNGPAEEPQSQEKPIGAGVKGEGNGPAEEPQSQEKPIGAGAKDEESRETRHDTDERSDFEPWALEKSIDLLIKVPAEFADRDIKVDVGEGYSFRARANSNGEVLVRINEPNRSEEATDIRIEFSDGRAVTRQMRPLKPRATLDVSDCYLEIGPPIRPPTENPGEEPEEGAKEDPQETEPEKAKTGGLYVWGFKGGDFGDLNYAELLSNAVEARLVSTEEFMVLERTTLYPDLSGTGEIEAASDIENSFLELLKQSEVRYVIFGEIKGSESEEIRVSISINGIGGEGYSGSMSKVFSSEDWLDFGIVEQKVSEMAFDLSKSATDPKTKQTLNSPCGQMLYPALLGLDRDRREKWVRKLSLSEKRGSASYSQCLRFLVAICRQGGEESACRRARR